MPVGNPVAAWYSDPLVPGQNFQPGYENGNDLQTPFHTPITALFGGTVVDASYQPWGGQVQIQANVPGVGSNAVTYYLHLDQLAQGLAKGAQVTAGQILGISGGENPGYPGALHPADPKYSTGAHVEFGIWKTPTDAANFNTKTGLVDPAQFLPGAGGTLPNAAAPPATSGGGDPCASIMQNWWDWTNPVKVSELAACKLDQNPNSGITQVVNGVGNAATNPIGTALNGIASALGFKSLADLGQRASLVAAGVTLAIIALIVVFFANKGPQKNHGNRRKIGRRGRRRSRRLGGKRHR